MATRSMIFLENEDNSVRGIYCHWDGYPEYTGRILKQFYNSKSQIESLFNKGSIECLMDLPEDCESLNKMEFYTFHSADQARKDLVGIDYVYVYSSDNWLVGNSSNPFSPV